MPAQSFLVLNSDGTEREIAGIGADIADISRSFEECLSFGQAIRSTFLEPTVRSWRDPDLPFTISTRTTSESCQYFRTLRTTGCGKSERKSMMREYFRKVIQRSTSKYKACNTTVLLRERKAQKIAGADAGRLLGKKDWVGLDDLIAHMNNTARDKFISKVHRVNTEFRERCFRCGNCGRSALVENHVDGIDICKKCHRTSCVTAGYCGHTTFRTYQVVIHHGVTGPTRFETVCGTCSHEYYYWESDGYQHSIPQPVVVVGNYHSSRSSITRIGKTIPGLPDIGFELEWGPIPVTIEKRDEISAKLRELPEIVAGVEQDGSVSRIAGAEIVTHYGSMDVVLAGATKVAKVLKGQARSHNTTCCGLHVSISRSGLSNLDIARFVVFWNSPKNTRFLVSFARRWSNQYCVQDFSKGNYKIPDREYDLDPYVWTGTNRYEIVNLCNNHRIEVRAFRGTTNKDMLRRCISLCVWIMAYCKDHSQKKLHYSEFLNWCKTARKTRGRRKFKPTDILSFAKQRGFLDNKKKPQEQPEIIQPVEGSIEAAMTSPSAVWMPSSCGIYDDQNLGTVTNYGVRTIDPEF